MRNRNNKLSEDTLRVIYSAQWSDVHHNRGQDWKLFNVCVVGLFGIGTLKAFSSFPEMQLWSSLIFAILSLLSIGITIRHAILNQEKFKTIIKIEKLLKADKVYCNGTSSIDKFFGKYAKVQYFLIMTYLIFFILFSYLVYTSYLNNKVKETKQNNNVTIIINKTVKDNKTQEKNK